MKNALNYIKLYLEKSEECFLKHGYYYPPRNWEEFDAWQNKRYEKHLKGLELNTISVTIYLSLLESNARFWYYLAFKSESYNLLNNVLYQSSRHRLLDSATSGSGTDHAILLGIVLSNFSCNDF